MRIVVFVAVFVITWYMLQLPIPWWASVLLLLLFWYSLGAPLFILLATRIPVDPPVKPFDPSEHDVSLDQLSFTGTATAQLRAAGFEPIGELFFDWSGNRRGVVSSALVVVLQNDAGTRAGATAIRVVAGGRERTRTAIELRTRFAGHTRSTSNLTPSMSLPSDSPRRVQERFPQVRDGALLARVHETLLAREEGTPPLIPDPAVLVDAQRDEYRMIFDDLAAQGIYRLGAKGTHWAPTLYGAYLTMWQRAWPMNRIRDARARKRASARLAELGLGTLDVGLA